jgi:hypothetical protein
MRRRALPILVALAVALPGLAAAQTTEHYNQAPPTSPTPAPTPVPRPHDDIIKLWKAKLSEDFIKKQIDAAPVPYNLTADEIIQCRDAGVPENLIQAMIQASAKASAPVSSAPAMGGAPVATPTPAVAYASQANRKWEGLVRRNSGVVLFKSRWDIGTLEFKEESLRWSDAKDASKNLMIPGRQFAEQFLTCLKKAGGNECFEWGFKTKDDIYRFRDVSWQQGENAKTKELADFFKAIYPSLILSEVAVDEK